MKTRKPYGCQALISPATLIASYHQLNRAGIKKLFDMGIDAYGYKHKTIVLYDDSVWKFIPEYLKYEKTNKTYQNESREQVQSW